MLSRQTASQTPQGEEALGGSLRVDDPFFCVCVLLSIFRFCFFLPVGGMARLVLGWAVGTIRAPMQREAAAAGPPSWAGRGLWRAGGLAAAVVMEFWKGEEERRRRRSPAGTNSGYVK